MTTEPKLTYLELAAKILNEVKQPLAPAEIWAIAVEKHYAQNLKRQGKTPSQTLYAAIFLDARDNTDSIFYKTGARPARYFLKSLHSIESEKKKEVETETGPSKKLKEKDLHPFLSSFVYRRFSAFTKTINHSNSTKKEYGEWVHPDMIGIYFPVQDWEQSVLELSKSLGTVAVKIYSFEIKKSLSFSNLRESFFQTVSNSSWAHETYLAAAAINTDGDFFDELKRLSVSFGVGIISLDIEDPDASEILIPSRENDEIDWEALNKLSMNKDVKSLLSRIKNDLSTNEVRREFYDPILDRDELLGGTK